MDDINGFVVGLGTKWVLVARTMDGGYPDGLIAIRVRDVSSLQKDRTFETAFAKTQSQPTAADLASIDLDRTDQVIETMSALARLVAIERERVRTGSTEVLTPRDVFWTYAAQPVQRTPGMWNSRRRLAVPRSCRR